MRKKDLLPEFSLYSDFKIVNHFRKVLSFELFQENCKFKDGKLGIEQFFEFSWNF